MINSKVKNRLSRVQGQLERLQENIAAEQDCAAVIPQFLAVKGAVTAAFEEYVKASLAECSVKDAKKMEQLIGLLIRA